MCAMIPLLFLVLAMDASTVEAQSQSYNQAYEGVYTVWPTRSWCLAVNPIRLCSWVLCIGYIT